MGAIEPFMPRPRTEDKRKRILEAAVKVFARKGYFAARVSEIARKAGVADGTIYLYFRSKEDILVKLFDEVMAEHVHQMREALRGLANTPERLRAIALRHLRVLGGNRDLAVVFQVELRQSTQFMERFTASWLQDYFALLNEVMEEGQRNGSLREDLNRKVATKAFFGALDEMVTSWIIGGKGYDLGQLATPVVDLFLRGAAAPGRPWPRRRRGGEASDADPDRLRHLLSRGRHLPEGGAPPVQERRVLAGHQLRRAPRRGGRALDGLARPGSREGRQGRDPLREPAGVGLCGPRHPRPRRGGRSHLLDPHSRPGPLHPQRQRVEGAVRLQRGPGGQGR